MSSFKVFLSLMIIALLSLVYSTNSTATINTEEIDSAVADAIKDNPDIAQEMAAASEQTLDQCIKSCMGDRKMCEMNTACMPACFDEYYCPFFSRDRRDCYFRRDPFCRECRHDRIWMGCHAGFQRCFVTCVTDSIKKVNQTLGEK